MSKRINKNILLCPECKSEELFFNEHDFKCQKCGIQYSTNNGKFYFGKFEEDAVTDSIDRVKFYLKRYPRLYQILVTILSPVYFDDSLKKFLNKYVNGKDIIGLNLGSGFSDISDNISNVDIFVYENVDLTCNIEKLPFKDNMVDVIINSAVLEHVREPEKIIGEIYRVLKKGGIVYTLFPFIQGYHASPNDFSRRTYEGIKELHKNFELIELKCSGGPTSGFLWIFQEWLALLLSFGIKQLYLIVHIFIMFITFPIKFLDLLFKKHPLAKNISSGFIFIGKKHDSI